MEKWQNGFKKLVSFIYMTVFYIIVISILFLVSVGLSKLPTQFQLFLVASIVLLLGVGTIGVLLFKLVRKIRYRIRKKGDV